MALLHGENSGSIPLSGTIKTWVVRLIGKAAGRNPAYTGSSPVRPTIWKGDVMIKLMKFINGYNKKADKAITEQDVRLALMLNRKLLIEKYDRKRNASKRI